MPLASLAVASGARQIGAHARKGDLYDRAARLTARLPRRAVDDDRGWTADTRAWLQGTHGRPMPWVTHGSRRPGGCTRLISIGGDGVVRTRVLATWSEAWCSIPA